MARAIVKRPDILLFDEPTSALNPETTGEVLNIIADLSESGMTMIGVTHEMASARHISDRIVLIGQRRGLLRGPIPRHSSATRRASA